MSEVGIRATPEGEPRPCPACRVVMLPDYEAIRPTIKCPQCGITQMTVL